MIPINLSLPSHNNNTSKLNTALGSCDTALGWVNMLMTWGEWDFSAHDKEMVEFLSNQNYSDDAIKHKDLQLQKLTTLMKENIAEALKASVMVHEETHFYQLIGTPFGRLLSEIDRVQTHDFSRLVGYLSVNSNLEKVSPPFNDWVSRNKNLMTQEEGQITTLALFSSLLTVFKHAFFTNQSSKNFGEFNSEETTIQNACNLWIYFLLSLDRVEESDDSRDDSIKQTTHPRILTTRLDPSGPACPIVDGRALSAQDIFEGVAMNVQYRYLYGLFQGNPLLPHLLRLINPGFINSEYVATRRIISNSFPHLPFRTRTSLLLILSELALQGSIYNDYFTERLDVVYWEDINPGYRFLRAIEVIKETELNLSGNIRDDYNLIAGTLFNELGWHHPVDMAEQFLKNKNDLNTSFTYKDPLFILRKKAAQARLDSPDFFADLMQNELEIHSKFGLKIPFVVDGDSLRMQETNENFSILVQACKISATSDLLWQDSIKPIFVKPMEYQKIIYENVLDFILGPGSYPETLSKKGKKIQCSNTLSNLSLKTLNDLGPLIEKLRFHEVTNLANDLELLDILGDPVAILWFGREPEFVTNLLEIINSNDDGSFNVDKAKLLSLLSISRIELNVTLTELLEDLHLDIMTYDIKRSLQFVINIKKKMDTLSENARRLWHSLIDQFGETKTFDDFTLMYYCAGEFSEEGLQELILAGIVISKGFNLEKSEGSIGMAISKFELSRDWIELAQIIK